MLELLDSWQLDTWGWFIACVCGLLVGFAKTGIAGTGILMVPLMADIFPAQQSSGILLPMLVFGDTLAVKYYSRHAHWGHLLRPMPWAVAGILAGYVFMMVFGSQPPMRTGLDSASVPQATELAVRDLPVAVRETRAKPGAVAGTVSMPQDAATLTKQMPAPQTADPKDRLFKRLIGCIVLGCLALQYWRDRKARRDGSADETHRQVPFAFVVFIGIMGGFTTMVANAAGPIWVIYLLAIGLPKYEFIGTGAWFFLILNSFKVPFQMHLGGITAASLAFNAAMVPAIIVGAVAGILIIKRINQELFRTLAQVLAAVAALRLL